MTDPSKTPKEAQIKAPIEYKVGDRGDEIAGIQRHLIKLGKDIGFTGPDGVFGQKTAQAIREFKAYCKLPDDCVVDDLTWKKLVQNTYDLGDRIIFLKHPNDRGSDVKVLQASLNSLGFNVGEIDGIFGPLLDHGVKDFQLNFDLAPDGVVGPATVEALGFLGKFIKKERTVRFPGSLEPTIKSVKNARIFIDGEDPLRDDPAAGDLSRRLVDIGLRTGNLFEAMNASVHYADLFDFERFVYDDQDNFQLFSHEEDLSADIRLTLGVKCQPDLGEDMISILINEENPDARLLVEKLTAKFKDHLSIKVEWHDSELLRNHEIARRKEHENEQYRSDKQENSALLIASKAYKKDEPLVFITLRFMHCEYNSIGKFADGEEYRQKLAVAIFDSIKDFYLSSRKVSNNQ